MIFTAYNRTHYPFAATVVAKAPSLEALKKELQKKHWTDIYNEDSSYHEQSSRGLAQIRIFKRNHRG